MYFNLFPPLLTVFESIDLIPQALDVIHATLQNCTLVGSYVSYDLVKWIVRLR